MNNRKLIASLLEFVSYYIFPFSFIFTHNLTNFSLNFYLLIMIAMVAFYKEYIRGLHPNIYFNALYSVLFFILAFLSYRTLNFNVVTLVFVQLVLLYLTKGIPENYSIVETLIDGFIIPSFISIAIAYTYAHFVSVNFIVPLLLVNISSILIMYFEGSKTDYLQIVVIAVVTIVLFFLKYINIWTSITIVAFVIVMIALKVLKKFTTSNIFYRLIGNFLLLI